MMAGTSVEEEKAVHKTNKDLKVSSQCEFLKKVLRMHLDDTCHREFLDIAPELSQGVG